jgi:hypothetical protein
MTLKRSVSKLGILGAWFSRGGVVASMTLTATLGAAAQQPPGQPPPVGGGRQGGGRGGAQDTSPPRALAPFDLTGYWVSVVTEDWRWRMVTPAKGDSTSVPLNPEGRRVTEMWDLAKDKANGDECKPYGAAGIIRIPMRLHITWQDDSTLKIETDTGQQTRLFHFGASAPAAGERTWQGYSVAEWFKQIQFAGLVGAGRAGTNFAGGNLKVVTSNMKPGYLRKNGVPYSENTVLTEYFNRHDEPNGDQWIVVTSVIEDPKYLTQPFILSTSFKKEADGSKWRPTPCEIDPPRD